MQRHTFLTTPSIHFFNSTSIISTQLISSHSIFTIDRIEFEIIIFSIIINDRRRLQESIDDEIVVEIAQVFSDHRSVTQDEVVRGTMDLLILAVVQNSNPLTFTTDMGRRAEGGYYCYAQGTCLFYFILYGMEAETKHDEILFIVAFQSYASIPTRTFYIRYTGIFTLISDH